VFTRGMKLGCRAAGWSMNQTDTGPAGRLRRVSVPLV
jgi:hypothetical protein